MHPGGTAWEGRPPARVVESGAAGRAVSAMVEEKRGRKGMLTYATPSLSTGAFQGTLHPPPTQLLAAPGQVIPMLAGNTGTRHSNDLSAVARGAFAVRLEPRQRAASRALDSHPSGPSSKPMLVSQSIQIASIHEIAFEWFDNRIHFPLRPVLILQQVLDAVPLSRTVVFATVTFIEKLTVLLAHILIVSSTIFDLHFTLHFGK